MYKKMNVTDGAFPIFDKVIVNGPGSSKVYTLLKDSDYTSLPSWLGNDVSNFVSWNFEKFLVNGDGIPVARYSSGYDPLDMEDQIVKLLNQQ